MPLPIPGGLTLNPRAVMMLLPTGRAWSSVEMLLRDYGNYSPMTATLRVSSGSVSDHLFVLEV